MEKNEKKLTTPKKTIVSIIISLIIMAIFFIIPAPSGLSRDGMMVLGVFVGVLVLWITVGIDWPSLLCLFALALVPSIGTTTMLQTAFGNQTFAFLLFTFMVTYVLSTTGFIKRVAIAFVNSKFAKRGPWHFAILFFLSVLLLGSFMSPTVLFFIYLPILEEIYKVIGLKKGDKYASMLMIGLVTCTSLSSAMTPIAHVFSVLAMGVYETATGIAISYASYMGFAIPAGLVIFGIMMLLFRFVLKPDTKKIKFDDVALNQMKKEIPKADFRELVATIVFIFVILLWVLPGLIGGFLPGVADFISKYGTALPPLLGVVVLSLIRFEGKPILNFNETMTKGVSWPALIMASSTLALGAAMTNPGVGLTAYLSSLISPLTANLAPILLLLLFIGWAAIQSNISSHMVTAQLVSTLAVSVAISTGSINAAAIAAVVGFVASIGSATPPSMPYVAVAGASGWTTAGELIKYGFIIMFATILTALLVAYPIANLIM